MHPRGLLHHGSTLACASGLTAGAIGGPFLWHYPSTRVDWTLSSILPYGARTFLSRHKGRQRLSVKLPDNICKYTSKRKQTQP